MNRSKQKGTHWESRVVAFMRDHGFPYAERRALSGALDKGDVNVPGLVIECKAHKTMALAEWVDEMIKEKANAGVDIGVVVFPRRYQPTDRAYVVMELQQFCEMVK